MAADNKWNSIIKKMLEYVHPDTNIKKESLCLMRKMIIYTIDVIDEKIIEIEIKNNEELDSSLFIKTIFNGTLSDRIINDINNLPHDPKLTDTIAKLIMRSNPNINVTNNVILSKIIDSLIYELLELFGNAAHDCKKIFITPYHIALVIRNDFNFKSFYFDLIKDIEIDAKVLKRLEENILIPIYVSE